MLLLFSPTVGASVTGYPLDDDGTNAALFGGVLLPTISPARNRATYTLTATTQSMFATPASYVAAPGLVTLVADVPLVCGFTIHSVPSAGAINGFLFQLYNIGGSGNVAINAKVTKTSGATTGTIQGEFGALVPDVPDFGTAYTGELIGAKIAFQLLLTGGSLSAKMWVNGTLMGTSSSIATNGGVVADLQLYDGTGTGVVDISVVPTVASGVSDGYGNFDTGAVDMVGVPAVFDFYLTDSVGDYLTDSTGDYLTE